MYNNFVIKRDNSKAYNSSSAQLSKNEKLKLELKEINERYVSLISIQDKLRTQALSQVAKINELKAFNKAAIIKMELMQWRHFSLSNELFGPPNVSNSPPKEIPENLMSDYTMNGKIPIEYNYLDATYPNNWPLIYTDYEIDLYLDKIARKEYFIYGMTDVWMWQAIEQFPIKGLSVVNMGSLTPWYESNCIFHGAKSTTIDYNKIITLSSRISTMTIADYDILRPTFDIAWSISSFEHDGLGMYGDPLDPEGDLKAMQKMKSIVKPGGLLFLSVPVGKDKILFNNARIYGNIRIPLLTKNWELITTIGLEPVHLEGPGHIQPIFILKNI